MKSLKEEIAEIYEDNAKIKRESETQIKKEIKRASDNESVD